MNTPPPIPTAQNQQDVEHLNLLAVFHFVLAGLGLLGCGFLAVHFLIMGAVMSGAAHNSPGGGQPPAALLGIMVLFYVAAGVFIVLGMVLNALSAMFLRQRRHRTFSMVVAGLDCLQFPFGTALGVFTLIVLMRESVRTLYERGP